MNRVQSRKGKGVGFRDSVGTADSLALIRFQFYFPIKSVCCCSWENLLYLNWGFFTFFLFSLLEKYLQAHYFLSSRVGLLEVAMGYTSRIDGAGLVAALPQCSSSGPMHFGMKVYMLLAPRPKMQKYWTRPRLMWWI